jgi:hypothetical protein
MTHSRSAACKDFIVAASKANGEALVSIEPEIQNLVALYAMVSRMRVVSSPQAIDCADNIMRTTIGMKSLKRAQPSPPLGMRSKLTFHDACVTAGGNLNQDALLSAPAEHYAYLP